MSMIRGLNPHEPLFTASCMKNAMRLRKTDGGQTPIVFEDTPLNTTLENQIVATPRVFIVRGH